MNIWHICTHLKDWLENRTKSKLNGHLYRYRPNSADRGLARGDSTEYTANKLDVFPLGLVKSLERRHLVLMGLSR